MEIAINGYCPHLFVVNWEGTLLVPSIQNPLELDVAYYGVDRNIKANFAADVGVFDSEECVNCIHHGLPNDDGWLENDVSLPNSGTGYYHYPGSDAADTDDWGE